MRPFLFLLLLYPLLELWVLVKVGSAIGALGLLALVILSGMAGLWILRRAGWLALWQARLSGSPIRAVSDGFLLALAGLLLLLPGLIGDVLGLALLLPGTRRGLLRRLLATVAARSGGTPRRPAEVIEGEFRREDPPEKRLD